MAPGRGQSRRPGARPAARRRGREPADAGVAGGRMKLIATVATVAAVGLLTACSGQGTGTFEQSDQTTVVDTIAANGGKGCITVDLVVSPEKITLLTDLAKRFNASPDS